MAFVGYAKAVHRREAETSAFRMYVAESVRAAGRGEYLKTRYIDIIDPPEDYDADETIASVGARAGLEVRE